RRPPTGSWRLPPAVRGGPQPRLFVECDSRRAERTERERGQHRVHLALPGHRPQLLKAAPSCHRAEHVEGGAVHRDGRVVVAGEVLAVAHHKDRRAVARRRTSKALHDEAESDAHRVAVAGARLAEREPDVVLVGHDVSDRLVPRGADAVEQVLERGCLLAPGLEDCRDRYTAAALDLRRGPWIGGYAVKAEILSRQPAYASATSPMGGVSQPVAPAASRPPLVTMNSGGSRWEVRRMTALVDIEEAQPMRRMMRRTVEGLAFAGGVALFRPGTKANRVVSRQLHEVSKRLRWAGGRVQGLA